MNSSAAAPFYQVDFEMCGGGRKGKWVLAVDIFDLKCGNSFFSEGEVGAWEWELGVRIGGAWIGECVGRGVLSLGTGFSRQ